MDARLEYPATGITENAVGAMHWLDAASQHLNPHHELDHRVSLADLSSFLAVISPPPSSLLTRWGTTVWSRPDEPFILYLVRCLANNFALTYLSPHIALHTDVVPDDFTCNETATASITDYYRDLTQGTTLAMETCQTVGLRIQPCTSELVQTGWVAQSCPHCAVSSNTPIQRGAAVARTVLPLQYGGDSCGGCGQVFPLQPEWSRRYYVVLRRADGKRTPAVAYGDALGSVLQLGATLRVLLYTTTTTEQQTLCIIHSAESAPAVSETMRQPLMLQVVARQRASCLCRAPFAEQRRLWAPHVLSQDLVKGLLLLHVVHALYRATRAPQWPPLHLLLIGPARCGKSALLAEVAALAGSLAEVVGGALVQHGDKKVGGSRHTLEASLPSVSGSVLVAGTLLESWVSVLDDIAPICATPHGEAILRELLEEHHVYVPTQSGVHTGGPTVRVTAQVAASLDDENRHSMRIASAFSLVARVSPQLSLGQSATISQTLMTASIARSTSRTASVSSCRSSPSGAAGCGEDAVLSAEVLLQAVAAAPSPQTLEGLLQPQLIPFFLNRLRSHASLLEAASVPSSCAGLPSPAALRGGPCPSAVDVALHLEGNLRTLCALTCARAVLCGPGMEWAELAEDVWTVYVWHLRSLAHLVALGASPPTRLPAEGLPGRCGAVLSAKANDAAAWPRMNPESAPVVTFHSCGAAKVRSKRRRSSRKVCKLQLVECMRQEQLQFGDLTVAVSPSRVHALYAELGGAFAMGDPVDVVLEQLQHEGLLIRRPGGWCVVSAPY